jgi:hypothetical protein
MLHNTSGHANTALGAFALQDSDTVSFNTAIGYKALFTNQEGAGSNTAVGANCMENETGGYRNTGIGANALTNVINGNRNTAAGFNAGPSGDVNYTGAFGYSALPTASYHIHIGSSSISWIGGQVNWGTYSDERFKTKIESNVAGLDFIMALNPVTYHWDITKLDHFVGREELENDMEGRKMQEERAYTGFLAQEVERAARKCNFDFSGIVHPANENTPYSLRYAEFVVPLVKAVQEQQEIIVNQQKQIDELRQMVMDERKVNHSK